MVILEDSRQQVGKHNNVHAFCDQYGIRIIRTKLLVGDYTLPTDQRVCVDTKYGMGEVYTDMVTDHARFHREYALAAELGIELVFLIEDVSLKSVDEVHTWHNPLADKYERGLIKSKPRGSDALQRQMETVASRYGVRWLFCRPQDTGLAVVNILTGGE